MAKVKQKDLRHTGSGQKGLFLTQNTEKLETEAADKKPIKRLMINILLHNFTMIPHTGCKMYKIIQSKWQKKSMFCLLFFLNITMLHIANDRDMNFYGRGRGQDLVLYKHDTWDASFKTQTLLMTNTQQNTPFFPKWDTIKRWNNQLPAWKIIQPRFLKLFFPPFKRAFK